MFAAESKGNAPAIILVVLGCPADAFLSLSLLACDDLLSQLFLSLLLAREHLSRKHVVVDLIVRSVVRFTDVAVGLGLFLVNIAEGAIAEHTVA